MRIDTGRLHFFDLESEAAIGGGAASAEGAGPAAATPGGLMDEGVLDRLRILGMSLYEARIYIGLLRHGPQNGNEVSKSAGIPSSKVYSTLERLASKGIVHSVRTGSGTQYVCVSPQGARAPVPRRVRGADGLPGGHAAAGSRPSSRRARY